MTGPVDLLNYRKSSYRAQLKELYCQIEASGIRQTSNMDEKKAFFRNSRARFIQIHRKKSGFEAQEVAVKINISLQQYIDLENGTGNISDASFFRLAAIVGANSEVCIFHEKIEEAFDPRKRRSRREMAQSLASYGYVFADPDKYESSQKGQILSFLKYPPK